MFSGGESNEGMNPMNPLGSFGFVNQAAVTNALAAGQNIDWAQLAQQWIQMRDNPETDLKEAPPPPNISFGKTSDDPTKIAKFEEKGEADMDMDDEDPSDEKSLAKLESKILAASVLQQQHNMNQPWFMDQAATSSNLGSQLAPQRLANNQQWNAWPNRDGLPQTNVASPTVNRPINPTAHIPSLLKINVPHPNEIRAMPDVPNQTDTAASMMDAAKRKGLPAWIREGLEKMEREKQKQMEKQQQVKDNIYSSEDDTNPVRSPKNIMVKSLITNNDARDNEDEDLTDNEATSGELLSSNHLTAMRNIDATSEYDEDSSNSVGKSYEQKLADLMIVVRRTLTELLLEVTNEEIAKVADESLKSFKSKASSAQVIRKSALSTITGKLGLAAYGDSSSDEDSNDDDDNSSKKLHQSESDNNSEDEIKNIIRSKRRAFVKISDEIEERAATAAVREEEKLKYFLSKEEEEERENRRKKQERSQSKDHASFSGYSGQNIGKGYDRDFGETTETKLQHLNGKRQKDRSARKERTTRFSDNKDKKYVALAATAAFITNMNATGSTTGTTSTTAATATLSSNLQHQPVPDFNGLLPEYRNAGMNNILNAADAALEKALKRKSSHSPDKYSRRRHRDGQYTSSKKRQRRDSSRDSRSHTESTSTSSSSTSSTSSSDSDSSTSRSSQNSKDQKRSTATKKSSTHSPHRSESKKSDKSSRDRWDKRRGDDDKRKYSSSSSSYAKRDHESSSSSRYRRRHDSSDSDDDYHRRKYDSHYSRNSSHSRTHTSSSSSRRDRDRDHSRSRSRSTYSSSSTRRH